MDSLIFFGLHVLLLCPFGLAAFDFHGVRIFLLAFWSCRCVLLLCPFGAAAVLLANRAARSGLHANRAEAPLHVQVMHCPFRKDDGVLVRAGWYSSDALATIPGDCRFGIVVVSFCCVLLGLRPSILSTFT